MSEDPPRPGPEPSGLDPDAAIQKRLIRRPAPPESEPEPESADAGGPADAEAGAGGDAAADRAVAAGSEPAGTRARGGEPPRQPLAPVIDTRRYQWMIGAFGLAVLIGFSIYLFVRGGNGSPGIAAGQRMPRFVAPLATSDLTAGANAHPVCDKARPARRGLNVCDRRPTVVAFFAQGATPCIRQVDTLQQVSRRFPNVLFAAVAVNVGHQAAAKLVRQHGWTIPVAYDESGVLGQVFGVEICPLVEVVRGNGIIAQRLLGEHWISASNLAGAVAKLGS